MHYNRIKFTFKQNNEFEKYNYQKACMHMISKMLRFLLSNVHGVKHMNTWMRIVINAENQVLTALTYAAESLVDLTIPAKR